LFIWRSPRFCNWAFNLDRGAQILEKWNWIPENVDILMTHGPPVGKSYCFYLSVWTNLTVMEYLCHNDHRYVPLVVSISRSFPHSWLFTGFVTRLTRLVPLLEQELLTLPEHLNSPPVFSSIRVTQSLVLYVYFVDRCLYFFFWPLCWLFFFDLRILITPLVSSDSS
jgi:hypothetical protein